MMRDMFVLILLGFAVQAYAKDSMVDHIAKSKDSTDKLVGQLAGNLVDRVLKKGFVDLADLDDTTMAKTHPDVSVGTPRSSKDVSATIHLRSPGRSPLRAARFPSTIPNALSIQMPPNAFSMDEKARQTISEAASRLWLGVRSFARAASELEKKVTLPTAIAAAVMIALDADLTQKIRSNPDPSAQSFPDVSSSPAITLPDATQEFTQAFPESQRQDSVYSPFPDSQRQDSVYTPAQISAAAIALTNFSTPLVGSRILRCDLDPTTRG